MTAAGLEPTAATGQVQDHCTKPPITNNILTYETVAADR
jgi:hypothetical protein